MEKNNNTPSQKLKKYKGTAFGLLVGEIAAVVAPYFTIGMINYNKYFIRQDGITVSIGFFIAMSVLGFTVWGIAENKFKNTFILFIFKYVAFALAFTFLQAVLNDIALIMWIGLVGLLTSYGLDKTRQGVKKKLENLKQNFKTAADQQEVEEIKKENLQKAEKTIKVRIKK